MNELQLTASQTVGPFFAPCLLREGALLQVLRLPGMAGEPIRLEGQVVDGDSQAVPDALVEIWQADETGHYRHSADRGIAVGGPGFSGFGRSGTAGQGYWFETIKPGAVPFEGNSLQAPHICMTVFARGLLNQVVTRFYFEDEAANASDPVLLKVPEERRSTLIARREKREDKSVYRLDIILQGEGETVFLRIAWWSAKMTAFLSWRG